MKPTVEPNARLGSCAFSPMLRRMEEPRRDMGGIRVGRVYSYQPPEPVRAGYSSRLTLSEAGNPVEVEFARRAPATGAGRNSGPKCLIEGKATPVQLLWR